MADEEMKANEEDVRGLKLQVKWCVEAVKKLIVEAEKSGVKLEIQPPPETTPPS